MNCFRCATHILFSPVLAILLSASSAAAASTLIDLTAEASVPARNDQARATVSADATGAAPAEVATQVNALVAEALRTAKKYDQVKTQSAGVSTYPIYAKNGKIETWRMRSELSLESVDMEALSELLGKLQTKLGVVGLSMQPAPETRKKAENEAMLAALAAFRSRASLLAEAMGKSYAIKKISVNSGGHFVQPMLRSAAKTMFSEAAPMPMEAGETRVTVTISGQIELAP